MNNLPHGWFVSRLLSKGSLPMSLVNLDNVQSNLKKERKVSPVTPVEVSKRHQGIVLW